MRTVLVLSVGLLTIPACVEPSYLPPTQTNIHLRATLAAASESHAHYEPQRDWSASTESAERSAHGRGDGAELVSALPIARSAAAANVLILESTHIDRPTEVIGIVDVHAPSGNEDAALAELRMRAASMGADAVLGVEFRHPDDQAGPTHLSGMAVRFRDLLRGREYDVLGPIDVREAMGHHDDAMGRLRSRAGEMHADLIINIHYSHGDAESPTSELRGTAIRLR